MKKKIAKRKTTKRKIAKEKRDCQKKQSLIYITSFAVYESFYNHSHSLTRCQGAFFTGIYGEKVCIGDDGNGGKTI